MPVIGSPATILGVFIDGYFSLNGVDLSDHVHRVTLRAYVDEVDVTLFFDTYRRRLAGLLGYVVDVEFNQDFSAGKVDETIFPILSTVVAFKARPHSVPPGETNPEYRGNVLITDYPALDGMVGDLARVRASWPGSGTLTRATSL